MLHAYTVYVATNIQFAHPFLFDSVANEDEFATKYLIQLIGIYIFHHYPIALVISGITLLVSPIGSIYLTNTKSGYSVRRQDNQFHRNSSLLNPHVY